MFRNAFYATLGATTMFAAGAVAQGTGAAPDAFPTEYQSSPSVIDQMADSLDALLGADEYSGDNALVDAHLMLAALNNDWGDPAINFEAQLEIIQSLHWLPSLANESIRVDVAQAVRDGLLDFYYAIPKRREVDEHRGVSARYYVDLAAAIQAASAIAQPNGDSATQRMLIEVLSNHSEHHPISGQDIFTDYLVDPLDVELFQSFVEAIWEFEGQPAPWCNCAEQVGPDIELMGVIAYRVCVRLCMRACNYIADPTGRAACRVACRAACLPLLSPKTGP